MSIKIVSPFALPLHNAINILLAGDLIAIPTETVYGLAADATNDQAVAKIFALKNRPTFNPLIIHLADAVLAEEYVMFDERARLLAKAFWPGPLTLVLARKPGCAISLLASAGLNSLAVRVPADPIARKIISDLKRPIAAPSANPSGSLSPTRPEHVFKGFFGQSNPKLIVDGGACQGGIESTVVNLITEPATLLRPGLVSSEQIESIIGPLGTLIESDNKILSPGQLLKHYAPQTKLRLNANTVANDEALLAFGKAVLPGAAKTLNLSATSNLVEVAANLFAMLHEVDQGQFRAIAVMKIPMRGIGIAINDRLKRAAQD
ncbi:MAG: threonylcarbamoyl-AMP synthase [Alphaproteobacteria bacterium]|nr:threonylcarbamoyl-AMP synthase [Alphaproteobacteria bacterium]